MKHSLRNYTALLLLAAFAFSSCKKEEVYVYEVNDVNISDPDANKPNVKSTFVFISIAYSDLFGTSISQSDLVNLQTAYLGFGDLKLVEEMIIKNLLNEPGADIPSETEMRADVKQFVIDAYKKLYNRNPNEFELWKLENTINEDQDITPELVYFAMMTSNEYRYY